RVEVEVSGDGPTQPGVVSAVVDHLELQAELLEHLISPPLGLRSSAADHEDAIGSPPVQQAAENQPRLAGLAEPHVVGYQQPRFRQLVYALQGNELVRLQGEASPGGGAEVSPALR